MALEQPRELVGLLEAVPVGIIQSQLNLDFLDEDSEDYEFIVGQLLPASWEACESFTNRWVWSTYSHYLAALTAELPTGCNPMICTRAFVQAVLLTLGHYYKNRESVADSRLVEMPLGAKALLWPLRANLGI